MLSFGMQSNFIKFCKELANCMFMFPLGGIHGVYCRQLQNIKMDSQVGLFICLFSIFFWGIIEDQTNDAK